MNNGDHEIRTPKGLRIGNRSVVDAFVSMVYLYDDQTMKIEFNCEDVIRRALEKYGA